MVAQHPLPPRWTRCPTDHRPHLLTHAQAPAAALSDQGRAWCNRRIPAAGLRAGWPLRRIPRELPSRQDRVVSGRARGYDRWRDADGTHIPVGAQVEQIDSDARRGALRSRLGQRGRVTGRGTTRLRVRFDGEDQTVSIRPHLVRVIDTDGDRGDG